MHQHAHATPGGRHAGRLALVLGLTLLYLVIEVVGGIFTGSLALLADAGHMLTDAAGLALALFAVRFASRPASPRRTYGYRRAEILAAGVNAVILIGVSLSILYEAFQRFRDPPEVIVGPMIAVAALGLVVNVVGVFILRGGASENLNLKGAYYEVLSDALASIGVIVAGIVMVVTGWYFVDPLISAAIGLFILPRSWNLLSEAVHVLLEGVPADVDLEAMRSAIAEVPSVGTVHDLHIWSLTSGVNVMTAHLVMAEGASLADVLTDIHERLRQGFLIDHVTIQAEPHGWVGEDIRKGEDYASHSHI